MINGSPFANLSFKVFRGDSGSARVTPDLPNIILGQVPEKSVSTVDDLPTAKVTPPYSEVDVKDDISLGNHHVRDDPKGRPIYTRRYPPNISHIAQICLVCAPHIPENC